MSHFLYYILSLKVWPYLRYHGIQQVISSNWVHPWSLSYLLEYFVTWMMYFHMLEPEIPTHHEFWNHEVDRLPLDYPCNSECITIACNGVVIGHPCLIDLAKLYKFANSPSMMHEHVKPIHHSSHIFEPNSSLICK